MEIVLVTRNPSKALQIAQIFKDTGITVLTLDDVGIAGDAVEDGNTIYQNAQKKVEFAWDQLNPKRWVMADDTGLFISALNGRPGVYSARWAGEKATTEEITAYTLKQLEGQQNRDAYFETAVIVMSPEGVGYSFQGRIEGQLLKVQCVPSQPKMPYSGIFVPKGSNKVWAEMTTAEENLISHRGIAFRQVLMMLKTLMNK